ncbi:MAG: bifunctional (p)ppGpp synthetase/guanosine-3',5'-bis(diphosphate) 3'-pyrophosphohydrolase [Pseudomonadota bacterium]
MIRLNNIVDRVLAYHPNADVAVIEKAYVFSAKVHEGQIRLSGEPYLSHPLEVAGILVNMRLDVLSIAAGLLHDTVEDTLTTIEEIKGLFGDEVAAIVDGVTKISRMTFSSTEERQAENIRKMILAMSEDIRVVLVKLADRVHNMRTLGYLSLPKQRAIAQETLDIYAPLAARLGINWMKAELEDLALYYLESDVYTEISQNIIRLKGEREAYIREVREIIRQRIEELGLHCHVEGRVKHIFSIYQKLRHDDLEGIEQIYDLIAFRIILGTVKECYEALGVVHSAWRPIPGRFKDYIGMPKENMYQSLHTTVMGPYNERMEVQIRTEEMHRVAEDGIAAHWRYKEGKALSERDEKQMAWLRRLMEWQKDLKDPREFLESVRSDLFSREVYIFTPKGQIREFPYGATPVDFAYAIHSEVGNHCTGSKVNGRLVPLKTELRNGDTVEIITAANHVPSKDWLKFVKTSKARNRIRQWIKTEERVRSVALGREIAEREFRKYRQNFAKLLRSGRLDEVAKEFSLPNADELQAAIGYGKLSVVQVLGKIVPREDLEKKPAESAVSKLVKKVIGHRISDGIQVKGVDDVLVRFSRCCNPLPGDPIVGYITRGRGVSVHVANCSNILTTDSERRVDVSWDNGPTIPHPVRIQVLSLDRRGALAEISNILTTNEANILEAECHTTVDKKGVCNFMIEVSDTKHLQRVMASLRRLAAVVVVKRLNT